MKKILQTIIGFLLTFTVLLQVNDKAIILSAFILQESYIADNLCEQREIPKNRCHGKCHLHKALEKSKKNTSAKNIETNPLQILFHEHTAEVLLYVVTTKLDITYKYPQNDYNYSQFLGQTLLKPPILSFS